MNQDDNPRPEERRVSLHGTWGFALDPNDRGVLEAWFSRPLLTDTIVIPGTTDEHRKGPANPACETKCLTRVHSYVGPAFYQREMAIPEAWRGKNLFFRIERTKHSTLWIDDRSVGTRDSLTTAHLYDVGAFLNPGMHRLTVRVDNANLPPVGDSHQTSEHTQTNWNGLLGSIELYAKDRCFIEDAQAYPDVAARQIRLSLKFNTACSGRLTVSAAAENSAREHRVRQIFDGVITNEHGRADVVLALGDEMQCWDEFNPALYRIVIQFTGADSEDTRNIQVGMRHFRAVNGQFQVNGRTTFLRGKHDACVFPLTGYAPMDKSEWTRVFGIAKSYGINHYRFHSWCPPKAAFEAADEIGIYMQPELPLWEFLGACNVDPMGDVEFRGSGDDSVLDARIRYLTAEGLRILKEFGNHASFCMFALGNELGGDLNLMASFVRRFRQEDPRHLYAHGSNNFIREPTKGPADDYWTTMMTGGHYSAGDFKPDSKGKEVRGSFCVHTHGHVNNRLSGTCTDYRGALSGVPMPVIGHEVGQYQMFPDFAEIRKYTGVLQARNLEVFKDNLEKAGMLDQANEFFRASGALSVLCYREDIEAALRTPGLGGFQLLDLQDFPGQGTALVGVLDAFMESKGFITPEAWREFCNDVVLLVKMDKYVWTRAETFAAELCLANYGRQDFPHPCMQWTLTSRDGIEIASGKTECAADSRVNPVRVGAIQIPLQNVACPQQLQLTVSLQGTDYRNRYPLWVHDDRLDADELCRSIRVAEVLDADTLAAVANGGRVLLLPQNGAVAHAVPGAFQSDFWCYPMFKKYNPPGTMGILCDPAHPALADFPTEFHSNWQWWRLLKNGCAMILDGLPRDLRPIVQVIDNFDRLHRLGVIFECRVGAGKLLVCSCNLLAQRSCPEARQLLASLVRYVKSDRFEPVCTINPDRLVSVIRL